MTMSNSFFFSYCLLLGVAAANYACNSEQGCWEDAAANFVQKKVHANRNAIITDHKEALVQNPSSNCAPVWSFTLDIDSNLVGILQGPSTGSGKTEIHRLSAVSNYQQYNLQIPTGLEYTYGNGEEWEFELLRNGDLMGILKGPVTGTGKTELHTLSAASNYKSFSLQIGTVFGYTDGGNWEFGVNPDGDLVGILKGPVTGSGKTEVHIASAASNYQSYNLQVGTGMGYTTGADWTFQMDGQSNLVGILKGPTTGSGKTEVHTLTRASNYQTWRIQTATAIGITNDNWAFTCRWNNYCDLFGILKGPTTGSGKTEIHAVSSDSNYDTYMVQVGTGMGYTNSVCTTPPTTTTTTTTIVATTPAPLSGYEMIGNGQCLLADGLMNSIGWAKCTCPDPENCATWPPKNCPSVDECAANCDDAEGCVAFDWYPGWCWLFKGSAGSYLKTSDEFPFYSCYAKPS